MTDDKAQKLQAFFIELRKSNHSLLMLDYDGTLSPFKAVRSEAVMYPGIKERLEKILNMIDTQVIIVSGRALKDLTPLVDLYPSPELWGSHGSECMTKDGKYTPPDIDPKASEGLEAAKKVCFEKEINPDFLEFKPASVALHWRGFDEKKQQEIENTIKDEWDKITSSYPLQLHFFNGGMELRPLGKGKDDAILSILSKLPEDAIIAYLGDDLTDEDAFKALGKRALKILVNPEKRETLADIQFFSFEEVLTFLDQWMANRTKEG